MTQRYSLSAYIISKFNYRIRLNFKTSQHTICYNTRKWGGGVQMDVGGGAKTEKIHGFIYKLFTLFSPLFLGKILGPGQPGSPLYDSTYDGLFLVMIA